MASKKAFRISTGIASCGVAAGANRVISALREKASSLSIPIEISQTGCIGMCHAEPILEVISPTGEKTLYGNVSTKDVERIVEEHLRDGRPVEEKTLAGDGGEFLCNQTRIVLRNCGRIDPDSIDDYVSNGGYEALKKTKSMSAEEIIDEMTKSGLRGRGGAGFPTGKKWQFARSAEGSPKYLICNADEGDPGAFMDRGVLESDPHSVLEGMAIAARAIGAETGYVYVRMEYPLAIRRMERAIEAARSEGFIGNGFDVSIKKGAGAFVCGEETALIASVEGRRGMPRLRPPFPAQSGLWNRPTNINNVETLAAVPWIIANGAEAFAAHGTETSKGTKVFALAGKVARGGLVEVPMGTTIRQVVFDIGGGMLPGKEFKAVQMGGPSGGCIPEHLADTPIDYESITATGAIMGSGGMVVLDDSTCMVDVARYFLSFTQHESCGKCTFCRLGTLRMLEILEKITRGEGEESDLKILGDLSLEVKKTSLCGLGQTAPNPVLTTLKYFQEEYKAHIHDGTCPAGVCKPLITFSIDRDKCTGCTLCAKSCPSEAISGDKSEPHVIDHEKCVKCGLCRDLCKSDAITVA